MDRRRVAVPVAALLSLALVSPAFAATSGQIGESFTVVQELSVTISTPNLVYGTILGSGQSQRVPYWVTVTGTPFALSMSGTDFMSANSILSKDARRARIIGASSGAIINQAALADFVVGSIDPIVTGPVNTFGPYRIDLEQWVQVPNVPAGSYFGSTTFTVVGT